MTCPTSNVTYVRLKHWFLPLLVPVFLSAELGRMFNMEWVVITCLQSEWTRITTDRGWQTFSGKDLLINISDFLRYSLFSFPFLSFPFYNSLKMWKITLGQTLQDRPWGSFANGWILLMGHKHGAPIPIKVACYTVYSYSRPLN